MAENPYSAPNVDATTARCEPRLIALRSIPFRSYISLCGCIGLSVGTVLGLGSLVASLFGVLDFKLSDSSGGYELHGVWAGLFALAVMPLYFGFILAILSVPSYFPFRILFRLVSKFRLLVVPSTDP